jgi:hypothetical protein
MGVDPETEAGASVYLALNLDEYLGHDGTFDYQRKGNKITGYTQLRQFRDVSNFNVGLFFQQAGLTLDAALGFAGAYARFRSSNAKPDQPYGLDEQTAHFITAGFNAGQSGVFGPATAH